MRGTSFGSPIVSHYSILGSMLGFPYLGKLPYSRGLNRVEKTSGYIYYEFSRIVWQRYWYLFRFLHPTSTQLAIRPPPPPTRCNLSSDVMLHCSFSFDSPFVGIYSGILQNLKPPAYFNWTGQVALRVSSTVNILP